MRNPIENLVPLGALSAKNDVPSLMWLFTAIDVSIFILFIMQSVRIALDAIFCLNEKETKLENILLLNRFYESQSALCILQQFSTFCLHSELISVLIDISYCILLHRLWSAALNVHTIKHTIDLLTYLTAQCLSNEQTVMAKIKYHVSKLIHTHSAYHIVGQ